MSCFISPVLTFAFNFVSIQIFIPILNCLQILFCFAYYVMYLGAIVFKSDKIKLIVYYQLWRLCIRGSVVQRKYAWLYHTQDFVYPKCLYKMLIFIIISSA